MIYLFGASDGSALCKQQNKAAAGDIDLESGPLLSLTGGRSDDPLRGVATTGSYALTGGC